MEATAISLLGAYLEGLPEPHIVCDSRFRIVAANAAFRVQYSPQASVLGRTCHEVSHHSPLPCDQAGESCPLASARRSGRREKVLHLHHTAHGEEPVEIELTPVPGADGRLAFFVERMQTLAPTDPGAEAGALVGRSAPFLRVLALVARVAPSNANVLLLGESGTGKEGVARAVHQASARAAYPLVVVDCASLPETLFESEVFGHEKGAFTGAHGLRRGLVEVASGGTLFLDEVGDIPLALQVKLLRLLEDGSFRRVGSSELRRADVRIIAATHRDLHQRVADGRFREDLFHRLATFPITLPPLRERGDDIALLVPALLARVAPQRRLTMSPSALALLQAQAFPGNVRELRNVLERAALMADGRRLSRDHVEQALAVGRGLTAGAAAGAPQSALPTAPTLKQAQRQALQAALAAHRGSRAELARTLGLSERSLYRKLRELDA